MLSIVEMQNELNVSGLVNFHLYSLDYQIEKQTEKNYCLDSCSKCLGSIGKNVFQITF